MVIVFIKRLILQGSFILLLFLSLRIKHLSTAQEDRLWHIDHHHCCRYSGTCLNGKGLHKEVSLLLLLQLENLDMRFPQKLALYLSCLITKANPVKAAFIKHDFLLDCPFSALFSDWSDIILKRISKFRVLWNSLPPPAPQNQGNSWAQAIRRIVRNHKINNLLF